ncbi:MAG TPA: YkgJ family cysteine cluster protein [Burkholderiaceae bacterium]|nr:YkgJ family cysteine cluster protein [Burkholderiaceae bacterium]
MNDRVYQLRFLRRRIPAFACVPGCHDCCGPVTASSEEMARLPARSAEERERALADWSCPHLQPSGCGAYEERPLICRLFGTTPSLPCPHGRRPQTMVEPAIEAQVHAFLRQSRQVLV